MKNHNENMSPVLRTGLESISLSFVPDDNIATFRALGESGLTVHLHSAVVYDGQPADPHNHAFEQAAESDLGLFLLAKEAGIREVILDARTAHNSQSKIGADFNKITRNANRLAGDIDNTHMIARKTKINGASRTVFVPDIVTVEYASKSRQNGKDGYDPLVYAHERAQALGMEVAVHLTSTHEDRGVMDTLGKGNEGRLEHLFDKGITRFLVAGIDVDELHDYLPGEATVLAAGVTDGTGSSVHAHERPADIEKLAADSQVTIELGSIVTKSDDPVVTLRKLAWRVGNYKSAA